MKPRVHLPIAVVLLALIAAWLVPKLSSTTTNAVESEQRAPSAATTTSTSSHAEIGFTSREHWLEHFEKHGAEFGAKTKEQYLGLAQALRDAPASDTVLEAIRGSDGAILKYDRTSGAFIVVNPDRTIRTFFKPHDGASYFERQLDKDH